MRRRRWLSGLALALALTAARAEAQDDPLARAKSALARSDYDAAEREIQAAKGVGALVLKTRLELWTGRYAQAVETARKVTGNEAKLAVAPWHAEALTRQGKLAEALKVLEAVKDEPNAFRASLLHGELLIRSGKRRQARPSLMRLVEAYNQNEIADTDAEGLSLVARAAYLLRSYEEANGQFNRAERVGAKQRVEALLWRAELFLDKYNPGGAGAVVKEALALAPNDPRVRVAWANVKLANAMDFAAAEEEVALALKVDPSLAEAYFVKAGLALRNMDIDAAMTAAEAGLKVNPDDLELLSIKAATRFLAEDGPGFDALKKQVLALNPEYSSFFSIVGEFAEWEHRYDDIVAMMREAVAIDDRDAKAYAQLGLNLIRAGQDEEGLEQLRKAWKRDKFNVRVFNTLDLYEDTIAKDYVTVDGATFRIRYHKTEHRILERYLPKMLDEAWASMVKRYGFTPKTPVGIEMYADGEHFSIRTSGLPNVGIQGVCFGHTLAALSPAGGEFNWGQVVWHELGHVFHIQMSKNRVPRWFTEGLAEYETIVRRPEWRREEERSLFDGLRDGKIPSVSSFNKAFTHVDSTEDVVMAYFAASQIAVFMAEQYGFDKVVAHLRAWGEGKATPEAIAAALGIAPDELDRRFHAWLEPRLERYRKQYVPDLRPPKSLEEARKDAADHPDDAQKLVKLALGLLVEGNVDEASASLQLALRRDPKNADALFVKLRIAYGTQQLDEAKGIVDKLIGGGHDGYSVRMIAANVAEKNSEEKAMSDHLLAAHRLDPSQVEPLQALYDLAHGKKDKESELWALREIAKLDQHDRRVWSRLLEMLVERGKWSEAVAIGESAIYVDVTNPRMHFLYGRALAREGKQISAIYELNSAIIAGADPKLAAEIYDKLAEGYGKLGKSDYARKAKEYAKEMRARPTPAVAPVDGSSPDGSSRPDDE